MANNYTYRKSEGEEIWTVGHDDNGKWIPESDWGGEHGEFYAILRSEFLNSNRKENVTLNLRKRIEEMMEGYRMGQVDIDPADYYRGAADACGLILDLPELRLFLPAKGEVE